MTDGNNNSPTGNATNNRPIDVRSFRELEIYKDAHLIATEVVREILPGL
jgi:hypothetical protein